MRISIKANIQAEINAVRGGRVISSDEPRPVFVSVPQASGKYESYIQFSLVSSSSGLVSSLKEIFILFTYD